MTRLRVRLLTILLSPYFLLAAMLVTLGVIASLDGPTGDQVLIDTAADVIEAPAQAHALMTAQGRSK